MQTVRLETEDRGSIIMKMAEKIPDLKKGLRKNCRGVRASLDEKKRDEASRLICKFIERWSVFNRSNIILAYLPMRAEVDLSVLLADHQEKTWLVPRILEDGEMFFHLYDPDRLIRHPFGMLEPDATLPSIPADRVELALIPGLAYDLRGWRLGYGGGFYDRFLSKQPKCIRLGVTFQALVLPDVPHQENDVAMQYLVTEDGLNEINPPSKR